MWSLLRFFCIYIDGIFYRKLVKIIEIICYILKVIMNNVILFSYFFFF